MKSSLLYACLLLGALCGSMGAFAKLAGTTVAITHVTVIDPGTQSVQSDRTVVIEGAQITAVADAATSRAPKAARIIDARGKYLIPGLWDMHVHTAFGDWFPGGSTRSNM